MIPYPGEKAKLASDDQTKGGRRMKKQKADERGKSSGWLAGLCEGACVLCPILL